MDCSWYFNTIIFIYKLNFASSGGGLEPNEDAEEAAIREVIEEAGVKGILGRCLGTFEVKIFI